MSNAPTATAPLELAALKGVGTGKAVVAIVVVSAAVFGFLVWLIYVKPPAGYESRLVGMLPAVNAFFNTVSATFLVLGFLAIKRREYRRHASLMLGALASSALFFVCYVIYHNFHGETKFTATGPIRPAYFFILISHIVLSGISVPLILLSFYLSLAGKLALHKRVSRYTFPVWLYVSVTGVMVFAMLKLFNPVPAGG